MRDISFIQNFIAEQVSGLKPAEIKTLVYRDGGVEIAPGEVVPAIIPEWLKDQTIEINLTGGTGTVKSDYGEHDLQISVEPETHQVTTNHEVTSIKDADPSHKITITFKGKLKDGDSVVVGRYSGLTKYVILCKAEK